jgi:hypothetical protein
MVLVCPLGAHARVRLPPKEITGDAGPEADLLLFECGLQDLKTMEPEPFPLAWRQVTLGAAFMRVNVAVPEEVAKEESPL